MYFSNFPITTYSLSDQENVLVTDFIKAVSIDSSLKTEAMFSDIYIASDNETPEVISHKVYGSTQYHWVIMMLNEKFDVYSDFPKSDDIIRQHTINRFGNLTDIHHYVDLNNNIVDGYGDISIPITNYEYMTTLNEEKREVKILKPELLAEFTQRYMGLIGS